MSEHCGLQGMMCCGGRGSWRAPANRQMQAGRTAECSASQSAVAVAAAAVMVEAGEG